jgi:hypothetical protein
LNRFLSIYLLGGGALLNSRAPKGPYGRAPKGPILAILGGGGFLLSSYLLWMVGLSIPRILLVACLTFDTPD